MLGGTHRRRRRTVVAAAIVPFVVGLIAVAPTRWERSESGCPASDVPEAWPVATPSDVGLAERPLEELGERATRGELGSVHAILVVRDGHLVFERYYFSRDAAWGRPRGMVAFDADTLHDLRSVTKSVVGALVGIAQREESISSLELSAAGFSRAGRLPSTLIVVGFRAAAA